MSGESEDVFQHLTQSSYDTATLSKGYSHAISAEVQQTDQHAGLPSSPTTAQFIRKQKETGNYSHAMTSYEND